MGSQYLQIEVGRHVHKRQASHICSMRNTGACTQPGDERHMLLECPALADVRLQSSLILLTCSGVMIMRRLLWAKDQREICRQIIACLDKMSSQ